MGAKPQEIADLTTPEQSPRKSIRDSISNFSSPTKGSRNTSSFACAQEQERRNFHQHLELWSRNHDITPYSSGRMKLIPLSKTVGLGQSVKCLLINESQAEKRRYIVVKLFSSKKILSSEALKGLVGDLFVENFEKNSTSNHRHDNEQYRLLVRYGAGWMTVKEFFKNEYFVQMQKKGSGIPDFDRHSHITTTVEEKDAVIILPLFRPFLRLPLELQQQILAFAVGPPRPSWPSPIRRPVTLPPSCMPMANLFKISKEMNRHLLPWIYKTTDFRFNTTGLTSFLWQSGPTNRQNLKHLYFRFGYHAALHCITWFSPDAVFDLFDPAKCIKPYGMQFYWRCLLQSLLKEVHLAVMTIDIRALPSQDLPLVVRILRGAFGGIDRIDFVDTSTPAVKVPRDDERLNSLKNITTWREMCISWFKEHRVREYSRSRLGNALVEMVSSLDRNMNENREFFDY